MTSVGHFEAPGGPAGAAAAGEITYLEAIRTALQDAMREDDRVFLLGEDIGVFGGAFGVTAGLFEEFGADRVMDTPISEEGFVGAAIGAAWMGERPVVELQFADFITCAFDPIVTVAAKTHWRSGQQIPITIRCPTGGGIRGGPFHAGSPEGWFVGTAGLKIVCPGTVEDAYGLLRAAIDDPDPVLYFEHKRLYRTLRAAAPAAGLRTPIGPAAVALAGNDVTVITYGSGVATALEAADRVDADVEIVDLRTIWPLDEATILASVEKTSRVLVLQEASRSTGAAGVILSLLARRSFEHLDAPPALHAPPDTPVPFAPELEDGYMPSVDSTWPPSTSCSPTDADRAVMPIEPCAEAPSVSSADRVALFRLVLLQRVFEDRVLTLYRQGRIPGSVYTGRGQEAVAAGAGLALGPDDVVAPLNRELACHFARGATTADAFRNFFGKATSPTFGRDGNMHFGAPANGVFPLVSMLGDLVPLVAGAALAFKRRGQPRVAMTFLGEGAFSVGDTHEGLNLAAVWKVPAVFVIQANRYSYSTPVARQMVNTNIAQRIYGGWSIPAERVDGTDALAVLATVRAAVERARNGDGPQAVEALTVRMHGHAGHDDSRYVPAGMREEFAERFDPVERLAARLALDGFSAAEIEEMREAAAEEVESGLTEAEQAPAPDPATLEDGVYAAPPF